MSCAAAPLDHAASPAIRIVHAIFMLLLLRAVYRSRPILHLRAAAAAEISALQGSVREDTCRLTFQHYPSQLEHIGAVRQLERALRVLLDQENALAVVAIEPPDQREHLVCQARAQSERRLVQHEHLGAAEQSTPDGQHLLLA